MELLNKSPLVFSIEPNLLEDRKDVFYYQPKYVKIMEYLKRSKYPLKTINEISAKVKDGTHFTPTYTLKGIVFLMVKNIKEEKIDFEDDVKFISEEEHKKLKSCQPEANDILLTKVGTIGIANVVPKNAPEFNIFVSVAKIELKKGINPYYVKAFLNSIFGRAQMNRFVKGVSQPDLHLIDIKQIKIPIPPINIQNKIAGLMEDAYKQKIKKIKLANKLIEEASKIVVKHLRINLPEVSKQNVYWTEPEILEDRRDPLFYNPKYTTLINAIENSPYEIKTLKQIIENT